MMAAKPGVGKSRWMIRGVLASLLAAMLSVVGCEIAHAETQDLNYMIDSSENQSYAAVIQQAEAMAGNSIARTFAENPSITEISEKVTVDRNGSLSPLLFIKVSRADWQNQPHVQTWAQYLGDASVLLGYRGGSGDSQSSMIASRPFSAPVVPSRAVNPNSEPNFYH